MAPDKLPYYENVGQDTFLVLRRLSGYSHMPSILAYVLVCSSIVTYYYFYFYFIYLTFINMLLKAYLIRVPSFVF